ncbi:MAG: type IV secretory system conjugative DNA transfer family protein, partial [Anaerolineae bacterium]|nr:type IV secretory system conjugative DNA transfer family protein [Anaerolineae bacterium]
MKRLWGVLANTTFERMFSNPHNKIDLFDAMNSGKVILINTAKDLLKQEGCEIFGRFFIAMIAQAAMERATLPKERRMNTFVYIDEAQDYFDEHIEQLLNQARKFHIGMHLAHQNLGQLGRDLNASIMASTSIKLAGGVSATDAQAFAREMRCDADFIHSTRKRDTQTEFACWVKHITPQAIKISVPLGSVEQLPVISDAEYETLLLKNRKRYCTTLEELERYMETMPPARAAVTALAEVPSPEPIVAEAAKQKTSPAMPRVKEPEVEEEAPQRESLQERVQKAAKKRKKLFAEEPTQLGRGGKQHTYIQSIVKQYAEKRSFRATIEHGILDGTGRVDVALNRDDLSIACEISITTTEKQELANIEKCLIAGYDQVLVISPDPQHLKRIKGYVEKHLETAYRDRVRFLSPDGVIGY